MPLNNTLPQDQEQEEVVIAVGDTIYITNNKTNQGVTRGAVTKIDTVETASSKDVTYTISVHPTRVAATVKQTADIVIFKDVDAALAEYKQLLVSSC